MVLSAIKNGVPPLYCKLKKPLLKTIPDVKSLEKVSAKLDELIIEVVKVFCPVII